MGDDPNVMVAMIAAIASVFVAIIGLISAFVLNRMTRTEVRQTKTVAQQTVENTSATSNGFAAGVNNKLDTLVADNIRITGKIDQMEKNHTQLANHVMGLGERVVRSEARLDLTTQPQLPIGR